MTTPRITINHLVDAAERVFCLEPGGIIHSRKPHHLIEPRRLVYLIARVWLKKSLSEIGRQLQRDHTTILHHLRVVTEDMNDQRLFLSRLLIDVAKGLAGAGRLTAEEWNELVPWLIAGTPEPDPSQLDEIKTEQASRQRNADEAYYSLQLRRWFTLNNARFIAAMRKAHPEREVLRQRFVQ